MYHSILICAYDQLYVLHMIFGVVAVRKPGLLKQFVTDLHSGKLHREFHDSDWNSSNMRSADAAADLMNEVSQLHYHSLL